MSSERQSQNRPPARSNKSSVLKENLLTVITIIGVVGMKWDFIFHSKISLNNIFILDQSTGGTIFGLVLKNQEKQWTEREIMYIQYPGDLFLRMLKCLIVPLLVSSITSAIGALDLSLSKKIALR